MQLIAFTAENPNAALAQVHERLGPEAVIVSVRQKRARGLSWLWNSRTIEVTACVPEKATERENDLAWSLAEEPAEVGDNNPIQARERGQHPAIDTPEIQLQFAKLHPARRPSAPNKPSAATGPGKLRPTGAAPPRMPLEKPSTGPPGGHWRSIAWLEGNGLLPAFTRQLEEKANVLYGQKPLPTMQAEWAAVTDLIVCHWLPARQGTAGTGRPHVFIGPPGSGKTTVLCKWMSSSILFQQQRVRVWRLDGYDANNSDLLALHCEVAGAPLERFWDRPDEEADLQFVDLPGIDARNESAMSSLSDQLSALPNPHVHLVLNAAYESSILLEQFRAFECFGPEDLIFTHLDEETRRVKLWNFVLGTKCPISFLSAGQKIPGELQRAEPPLLFPQKNN